MKKLTTIIVAIIAIILMSPVSWAEESSEIQTGIKVMVNGVEWDFEDNPVLKGNVFYLPLEELLEKLGITDEQNNLLWYGKNKIATFYLGEVKVSLQVSNRNIFIENKINRLYNAPEIFGENKVYVPAIFVSRILGKKLIVDQASKTIAIREPSEFDRIIEVLEKSDEAMSLLSRYRYGMTLGVTILGQEADTNMEYNISSEVDAEDKLMYMLMGMDLSIGGVNVPVSYEMFYKDYMVYMSNSLVPDWQKEPVSQEEFDSLFTGTDKALIQNNNDLIRINEIFAHTLCMQNEENRSEIVLKGDALINSTHLELPQIAAAGQGVDNMEITFTGFHVEIFLDKATMLVNRINILALAEASNKEVESGMEIEINMEYSDLNGDFEIKHPLII